MDRFNSTHILRGTILAALLLVSALILSAVAAEASFLNEPEGAPYFGGQGEPEGQIVYIIEGPDAASPTFVILDMVRSAAGFGS